jgi:hypothetical protein
LTTTTTNSQKDLEPVITDWAMSVIEGRLREKYRVVPDDTDFVSFIQEAKEVTLDDGFVKEIPPMAVFAIVSDHPTKAWSPRIMTHGTASLRDFMDSVAEQKHFTNYKPEPAFVILEQVLRQHLTTLSNLKDMIH